MACCEQCWSDAHGLARERPGDVVEHYYRLLAERKSNPCTPEEQAGPDATVCQRCGRRTLHQYTRDCMARCAAAKEG